MTEETAFHQQVRYWRSIIPSQENLRSQQRMIDNILAASPGMEQARQRVLEMADAGTNFKAQRDSIDNAAKVIGQTASLQESVDAIQRASEMAGVKWVQSAYDTAARYSQLMESVNAIVGVNLGVPRVDAMLMNAKATAERGVSAEEEQRINAIFDAEPELAEEVEQFALLVDASDPENRRLIVWGIKIAIYLTYVYALTLLGDNALAVAGALSAVGVNPVQIANSIGEKADKAMQRPEPEASDE
ncbi:hypothetical protein [Arthrobacter bambusae]|uniref:hypothetical protein n=1 Tax=Arthrobacter bambusae TaxID=1338426 RepID=UPI00278B7B4B|nr:hypothetical protein [Arthrobacter bambusae]MDQ0032244.1 hypothetical protein [Arthrobacter bambusae]MDQ0100367.1 hypothetical protein [Arthrobacter bambusae]